MYQGGIDPKATSQREQKVASDRSLRLSTVAWSELDAIWGTAKLSGYITFSGFKHRLRNTARNILPLAMARMRQWKVLLMMKSRNIWDAQSPLLTKG